MKIIVEAGQYDFDEVTGTYAANYKFVASFADADKAEMEFMDTIGYEFRRMYCEMRDQRILLDGDSFDDSPLPEAWNLQTMLCSLAMEITQSQCAPIDPDECCDLIRQQFIKLRKHNASVTDANNLLREHLKDARNRLNTIKEAIK